LDDQVKEDEMRRECSTNGEKMNAYKLLVGKPEIKGSLRGPNRRSVHNIKMDVEDLVVCTRF
jgi:hypothetical protein